MWHQIATFAEVKITLDSPWARADGPSMRVTWRPHCVWDPYTRSWTYRALPVELRQGGGLGPSVPFYASVPTLDHAVAWHGVPAGLTFMDGSPSSLYREQLEIV